LPDQWHVGKYLIMHHLESCSKGQGGMERQLVGPAQQHSPATSAPEKVLLRTRLMAHMLCAKLLLRPREARLPVAVLKYFACRWAHQLACMAASSCKKDKQQHRHCCSSKGVLMAKHVGTNRLNHEAVLK
jgi:hypothetical protein